MKLLAFFFILAIYDPTAKAQENVDVSAEANAELGGCSAGGNGKVNGDTNGAEGSASSGVSGYEDAGGSTSAGYTYLINAIRVAQVIPPGYPVMYMYYQISDLQNVTYFKIIDNDNPLTVESYISNSDINFSYFSEPEIGPNVCDAYEDGTWDYVAASVAAKGILPGGKCPVKAGNYDIDRHVDPVTVTFADMIYCGKYTLDVNLYRGDEWACQLGFEFTIQDDGSCIQ